MKAANILRWSGSKAKLVPHLLNLAPVSYERYVEPFAGSAQLFFALNPSHAILGDLNEHVMDVYRAIAEDPNAVADALESIPLTVEAYYTLRGITPSGLSLAQRAARLIFLMKACFNGVYRTNRLGTFNVPMGSRIYALPTRTELQHTRSKLQDVVLVHGDFSETLSRTRQNDWIYLDPPYRQSGRYRGEYGYEAEFRSDALSKLLNWSRTLANGGRHVMLSYLDDERLVDALPGWSAHRVRTVRTVASAAGARREIQELVMTSYRT